MKTEEGTLESSVKGDYFSIKVFEDKKIGHKEWEEREVEVYLDRSDIKDLLQEMMDYLFVRPISKVVTDESISD